MCNHRIHTQYASTFAWNLEILETIRMFKKVFNNDSMVDTSNLTTNPFNVIHVMKGFQQPVHGLNASGQQLVESDTTDLK